MRRVTIAERPGFRFLLAVLLFSLAPFVESAPRSSVERRAKLQKMLRDGNHKEAFEGFSELALDPSAEPQTVSHDLQQAVQCLNNLRLVHEIEDLVERVIGVHAKNWQLLQSAAHIYSQGLEHNGFMIGGEYHRGHHRGGGKVVHSWERDRIRALQLMAQALPFVRQKGNGADVSSFYSSLAHMLRGTRGYNKAWRLQYLSDLSELPDYEDGQGFQYYGQTSGAPVDSEGQPVFHYLPKSWKSAKSDGERWRWALHRAIETYESNRHAVRMQFASFLREQFGVQTMQQDAHFFSRPVQADKDRDNSGSYELHTLGENETIARLAIGIRRFALPDEFNYIKIYRESAAEETRHAPSAVQALAEIFENRRQYPRAAAEWRSSIEKYGPTDWKRRRLQQIVGNWGRFEDNITQPAGEGAKLEFRYRNGKKLQLEAHVIKHRQLLADVKRYLKSDPGQLDWKRVNIAAIGRRLVHQNDHKYVGKRVARWELDLDPLLNHFDRRIHITTPLQKAGAYLVTATMEDGNTSKVVVWLSDTVIVKKPLDHGAFYFVADVVTGQPIAKANLELFGYRQERKKSNRYRIHVKNFAEYSDANGQVFHRATGDDGRYQWVATATTEDGRFAFLGYTSVWAHGYREQQYNQTKVFGITDRPVYRPDQSVNFKFWVRHAQYDKEDVSQFAHQSFRVEVHNPKGEKILSATKKADEFGGFDGEYALAKDATLGVYSIQVVGYGRTSFRVEEYKKPEFEVAIDAPSGPVALGEKITAKINAKYYFGSPVTEAKVKYKVLRRTHTKQWYPYAPWDWLYGPGYWWYASDYQWYPGWHRWGCRRPFPWWWGTPSPSPEVVAEVEARIGADGTLAVDIDTAMAKATHPDQDHSYEIIAEVVDASRRTIVGRGHVLASRQPFKVFAWLDRGYYREGDTIHASFSARTLDDQPVEGTGRVTLYEIRYDDKGQPVETGVHEQGLNTNDRGEAVLQLIARDQGQYRIAYTVTDAKDHTIEGGYVFTIIGDGFDGSEFRFNSIELLTNQREYRPGEKVKLQVNTNRMGATVVLFVRPANGVYLRPRVLKPAGKSSLVDITVTKKDMPNFFVEAFTVANGKVHSEVREIHVPPEKRVLNVEVLPSAETYKPGEKAKVKLRLTDFYGEPYSGTAALSIYDKAMEYISGGSNVPAIADFFWKWRRHHRPRSETNLQRSFPNLVLPKKIAMQKLGIFGDSVADELGKARFQDEREVRRGRLRMLKLKAAASVRNGREAVETGVMTEEDKGGDNGGVGSADLVQPTVRKEFADTALWVAALTTDVDGIAEVELGIPENLTTWKVKVWGVGHGTKVGEGEAEVVTRKDLIIRLQAPRFFVQKDEVVLSANVHNYLASAKRVQVALELEGGMLKPLDDLERTVRIEPNGEARVDWRVEVTEEGEAVVRMLALTDEESDAMEMRFPVYVHGMLKMDSFSGVIRPEANSDTLTLVTPEARRVEASRLELRYSPTLAGAMVDALPYLVEYPYGCTEQTLNRFLPTVITQKILLNMELDLEAIRHKRTNLNAQEIGDDVARASGWKRYPRNPVFDEQEVRGMAKEGVRALTQMQLSDGGWGWFSGWGERSYPHTTAVVVHGLQIALENDVALVPGVLENGVDWLTRYQSEQVAALKDPRRRSQANNLDALVYMVLVDAQVENDEMMEFLYRDRNHLAIYGKSMLGLALHKREEAEKLAMILRNIEQFLVEDDENQTAYLNLPGGYWWYWYGSEFEAHAYYLKLLARTNPKGRVASRLVKYLLSNRKHATYWNSTRDTALCVEAMADYLKATGEDRPDMVVEVWLNGEKRKEVKITAGNLFTFDNKFVLYGADVTAGTNTLEVRKHGTGSIYYNAYLTNFTLEDYIKKAGLEVRVERKFYKLVPVDKQIKVASSRGEAVDQKVEKYKRIPLADLATLNSGDRVEVELVIESKNDYEYLIFEDMKAAGFETVEVRSGYNDNEMGAYMELRDNRVSFFVRHLARGRHSVAYRLRAEIPGKFSALPTRAYAMYAPELKGNSDEIKLWITD